jgi:hypothetical protein
LKGNVKACRYFAWVFVVGWRDEGCRAWDRMYAEMDAYVNVIGGLEQMR